MSDFTARFHLTGLKPDTAHKLFVRGLTPDGKMTAMLAGGFTWEQGLAIFREQFPMGEKPYRTVRWGKDLQVWMVEGRDFRSPNNMPDSPEKSILGAEQKKWLFDTTSSTRKTFPIPQTEP